MVVIPINVCVPDDIYDDVLNGSLELYSLVKDGEHKVRKHLPTIKNASIVIAVALEEGTGIAVTVFFVSYGKKKKDNIINIREYLKIQKDFILSA